MDLIALYFSLKLSLVKTVVLTVIASPLAYGLSFVKFPGKSFVEVLINMPMALPPTVMGFYLVLLTGPQGSNRKHVGEHNGRIAPLYFSGDYRCHRCLQPSLCSARRPSSG